jgi:hypothetical protein
MKIDIDTAAGIDGALNEAALLAAEYDADENVVRLTFSVLTLPDDHSPEPSDPRRQIILTNVARIIAALRESRWDDLTAEPVRFAINDLPTIVRSFGGQALYGWEFVNYDDGLLTHWAERASLVLEPTGGSLHNRILLSQDGGNRFLDLWIWFEDLLIRDPLGAPIALSDFIAGGKRWWDALFGGDPRTQGHGIVPGGRES